LFDEIRLKSLAAKTCAAITQARLQESVIIGIANLGVYSTGYTDMSSDLYFFCLFFIMLTQ